MARFEPAYKRTAKYEGGFQKMPEDTGNYNSSGVLVGTNWGINARVYEKYIGRPPSEAEMRNMPKSTAKEIYRKGYWNKMKGGSFKNQKVAEILYDGFVNHGYWGIKMMQRLLGLTEDGIVGPVTLTAINTANPSGLYLKYKEARKNFYHWLAGNRPGHDRFLNGWLNRINAFTGFVKEAAETIKENPGKSSAGFFGLALLAILILKR